MEIRTATMNDLDAVAAVEAECFPVAEAATKEEFAERIKYYGDHFWLMFEGDKLIAFLHVRRKRLFGEHMLAVLQRGFRHAIVLIRTGKVQNNLHFGIVERFIHILINFRHGGFCACFNVFLHRLYALQL